MKSSESEEVDIVYEDKTDSKKHDIPLAHGVLQSVMEEVEDSSNSSKSTKNKGYISSQPREPSVSTNHTQSTDHRPKEIASEKNGSKLHESINTKSIEQHQKEDQDILVLQSHVRNLTDSVLGSLRKMIYKLKITNSTGGVDPQKSRLYSRLKSGLGNETFKNTTRIKPLFNHLTSFPSQKDPHKPSSVTHKGLLYSREKSYKNKKYGGASWENSNQQFMKPTEKGSKRRKMVTVITSPMHKPSRFTAKDGISGHYLRLPTLSAKKESSETSRENDTIHSKGKKVFKGKHKPSRFTAKDGIRRGHYLRLPTFSAKKESSETFRENDTMHSKGKKVFKGKHADTNKKLALLQMAYLLSKVEAHYAQQDNGETNLCNVHKTMNRSLISCHNHLKVNNLQQPKLKKKNQNTEVSARVYTTNRIETTKPAGKPKNKAIKGNLSSGYTKTEGTKQKEGATDLIEEKAKKLIKASWRTLVGGKFKSAHHSNFTKERLSKSIEYKPEFVRQGYDKASRSKNRNNLRRLNAHWPLTTQKQGQENHTRNADVHIRQNDIIVDSSKGSSRKSIQQYIQNQNTSHILHSPKQDNASEHVELEETFPRRNEGIIPRQNPLDRMLNAGILSISQNNISSPSTIHKVSNKTAVKLPTTLLRPGGLFIANTKEEKYHVSPIHSPESFLDTMKRRPLKEESGVSNETIGRLLLEFFKEAKGEDNHVAKGQLKNKGSALNLPLVRQRQNRPQTSKGTWDTLRVHTSGNSTNGKMKGIGANAVVPMPIVSGSHKNTKEIKYKTEEIDEFVDEGKFGNKYRQVKK